MCRYDEDDYKAVKDLKKDIEENIDRYEDILTHLEGVYAAKPTKFVVEIDELAENCDVIAQRRSKLRGKVKEAFAAIENERNKYEAKKSKEDREATGSGKRGGGASNSEKQFKQPQGSHPDKISSEYTPLMAQNWAADMRLYIKQALILIYFLQRSSGPFVRNLSTRLCGRQWSSSEVTIWR